MHLDLMIYCFKIAPPIEEAVNDGIIHRCNTKPLLLKYHVYCDFTSNFLIILCVVFQISRSHFDHMKWTLPLTPLVNVTYTLSEDLSFTFKEYLYHFSKRANKLLSPPKIAIENYHPLFTIWPFQTNCTNSLSWACFHSYHSCVDNYFLPKISIFLW